jgi:hypothetical protein
MTVRSVTYHHVEGEAEAMPEPEDNQVTYHHVEAAAEADTRGRGQLSHLLTRTMV